MTEQDRIKSIELNGGLHLKNFKPQNITYQMCLTAVKRDGNAIRYVPEAFRTKEIYTEACRSCGDILSITPNEFISEDLYKLSVKSDGMALGYIPNNHRTAEISRLAVLNTPAAFKFVPEALITAELCLESMKAQSKPKWDYDACKNRMTTGYESFSLIPAAIRNTELCLDLVKLEPEFIWLIPQKNRTKEVCKAAIEAYGYRSVEEAIEHEPRLMTRLHKSLCTEKASLIFVNSDYFTDAVYFNRYPKAGETRGMKATIVGSGNFFLKGDEFPLKNILRWPSVAEIAVVKCWLMLEFVPGKTKNYDICEKAVKADPYAIMFVPDEYKTRDLCMYAFEHEKWVIKYFPGEFLTEEICKVAVDNGCFTDIPETYKTKELCLRAVAKSGIDVMYVPKEVMDEDIAIAAAKTGTGLYHIPKEYMTYNVCLESVKALPTNIRYVPKELLTDELKDCSE